MNYTGLRVTGKLHASRKKGRKHTANRGVPLPTPADWNPIRYAKLKCGDCTQHWCCNRNPLECWGAIPGRAEQGQTSEFAYDRVGSMLEY